MENIKTNEVGTFEVTTGMLIVSDPCYNYREYDGSDYKVMSLLADVRNGKWNVFTKTGKDTDGWGNRVMELFAFHDNYMFETFEEFNPDLCVDSGQMSINDASAYPSFNGEDHGEYDDLNGYYGRACALTQSKEAGVFPGGCVSSSGFGDGGYPGYLAKDSHGRVVAVKVVFIDENARDEDEDEQEEE